MNQSYVIVNILDKGHVRVARYAVNVTGPEKTSLIYM